MGWLIAQIRRWWKSNVVPDVVPDVPPHERWPEILHWQAGDEFEHVYSLSTGCSARLISLREDGCALCWDHSTCSDHKIVVHISHLVGHNSSLRDRKIDAELRRGSDYMELINQFNIAYKELQERDKRNGIAA